MITFALSRSHMINCQNFKVWMNNNSSASGIVGKNIAKLMPTIMFFVHKDLGYEIEMDFPSSFIEQKSAAFLGAVTTPWQI